jgi:hypothetical protein
VEGIHTIAERDFVLTADLEKQLNAGLHHGEIEFQHLMEQSLFIEGQEKQKLNNHKFIILSVKNLKIDL